MLSPEPAAPRRAHQTSSVDNRIFLHDVSWRGLEHVLELRGDRAGVRLTYLHGELELTSPSTDHEAIKKTIARLVEAFAEELGLDLNGVGSWTIARSEAERAAEPDECYVMGSVKGRDKPDLAIEVVWTSGGIDKLDVYRGLGVREVWIWQDGAFASSCSSANATSRASRANCCPVWISAWLHVWRLPKAR